MNDGAFAELFCDSRAGADDKSLPKNRVFLFYERYNKRTNSGGETV